MFGTGTASQLIQFLAGVSVFGYCVMLALNENGANVSSAIKVVVVISALTSIGSIVTALFGVPIAC